MIVGTDKKKMEKKPLRKEPSVSSEELAWIWIIFSFTVLREIISLYFKIL